MLSVHCTLFLCENQIFVAVFRFVLDVLSRLISAVAKARFFAGEHEIDGGEHRGNIGGNIATSKISMFPKQLFQNARFKLDLVHLFYNWGT